MAAVPLIPRRTGPIFRRSRPQAALISGFLHLLVFLLVIDRPAPMRFGLRLRAAPSSIELIAAPVMPSPRPAAMPAAAPMPVAGRRSTAHRKRAPFRRGAHKVVASASASAVPRSAQPVPPAPADPAAIDSTAVQGRPRTSAEAARTPPAAPAVSTTATGAERREPLPRGYLIEVSRMIRVNLVYPWQARRDRREGMAIVHMLLARDGRVVAVSIVRGAGDAALDAEACEVVLRIGKFPELPAGVLAGDRLFAIDQPIRFRAG